MTALKTTDLPQVITQEIKLNHEDIQLFVRREDLIHPFVSGNKFRKLRYNLEEAFRQKQTKLVTFGGAFSNHIAAVAFAGKTNGFETIGIIRGDELKDNWHDNPTLQFAYSCGMQFEFVTREVYRSKEHVDYLEQLKAQFGTFYLIPEGGTNAWAVKGCEEIITERDAEYDYVCVAVGTGGTISGIINGSFDHQKIIGFPVLKGDFLQKDICSFAQKNNWSLNLDYHFGGYGKVTPELIQFINSFYGAHAVPLDPIYTGKMVFGVMDLIEKNYFEKGSKILLIHTGGLQGIEGMNKELERKKQIKININD
jgi:1-aminocyclopropane-1-carboxylate deaminase